MNRLHETDAEILESTMVQFPEGKVKPYDP